MSRVLCGLVLLLTGSWLSGCVTHPDAHLHEVGEIQQLGPALVSLGAGDALGSSIYANDVMLADRERREDAATALADAPVEPK